MTRRHLWPLAALQASALALAAWVGTGQATWILVAGPSALAGLFFGGRKESRTALAVVMLLGGTAVALAARWDLDAFARAWPERSQRREAEAQERLSGAVDTLLATNEEATDRLAALVAEGPPIRVALPDGTRPPRVDALALFGPSGELLAWDGSHQGPIPQDVRTGASRYVYHEGAIFGYLYVSRALPSGGTAVAATLLRSDLPESLEPRTEDFRSRFERETGARIDVSPAERARGESVFDIGWENRVLVSVTLLPASEADARAGRELAWIRVVATLVLAGWLLSLLGTKESLLAAVLGGASLAVLVVVLPLGRLIGSSRLFSPAEFLLPGPLPLTLGDALVIGLGGAAIVGLLPSERLPRIRSFQAAAVGGALVAGLLFLFELGVSRNVLAEGELAWIVFQGATAALCLLVLGVTGLLGAPDRGQERGPRSLLIALSIGAALALSLAAAAMAGRIPETLSPWISLLWMVPLWGVLESVPRGTAWSRHLLRYVALAVVAVSVVLPWAWNLRVAARIEVAEERVERLGTRPDPFLEFLLLRFGEQARALDSEGRDPVEVLYRAWTGSGLALESVPLWITFWSPDGAPQEELQIGVSGPRPLLRREFLEEGLVGPETLVQRFDLADTHYVGVAPLPRGSAVTVILPPRRILSGSSPLGPLFSPARGLPDPLVLVPRLPGEVPGTTEEIEWIRTAEGWQGETYLAYPDEVYQARYVVVLPDWILLLARGTLLLLLDLSVLGLLWTVGRWLQAGGPSSLLAWLRALGSFRGRVTLALFGFFLVPSILFGTLAYRTLDAASRRTDDALATRVAEDAASWYVEVGGEMDALAGRVGSDLLLYEDGELVRGSKPELLELGLYEGWLPPSIYAEMMSGQQIMATATAQLGGWDYVLAFQRIAGGLTLAAPAPLQAGATALRQREVADLLGFSVVMGAVLSTLLALLVGRTLALPIQTLRVASERVGGGNMAVRLPEERTDEFGAVFDAFNRMVDRLAQARRALLRSSRRTRAIVEEVATGVVALDARGRVKLGNPKAAQLVGAPLTVNLPLPGGEGAGDGRAALRAWVDDFFAKGALEASREISLGARRVRIRARRISRRGPPGGAVLTLEDVTDELRTERILAWGEVAQQVAHEVKNPLTPMKLGVQHIQRAWEDGRPDYEDILRRNVDAIVQEIDRLASIASSFSRFGPPGLVGAVPLEAVSVGGVVEEVLDLYRAGEGPVHFEFTGEDGLPAVRSRIGELKEVLVNLLENARTALPGGGTVRVEALATERGVDLHVKDTGTGIPPELLPRVFDPHFSTRSGGTGLGLAIVRRLVESWGGAVHAESRPGQGTVIQLHLVPWEDTASGDISDVPDRGSVPPADS